MASLHKELSALLNTRRSGGRVASAGEPLTVLDYGIPDFSVLSTTGLHDRGKLAQGIAEAIRSFEPRLRNPQVQVHAPIQPGGPARVAIAADAVIDKRLQRVEFDLSV